ncbi:MAG: hypothetical protein HY540_07085 [Deltaproteobacteria bacterium]|nr:hypothetical protein [Deltaproteobacteria bacterium]
MEDVIEGAVKEMEHRFGIMVEAFDHKLDLVVEGIQGLREEMNGKMTSLRDELKSDIHITQAAVRLLAQQIQEVKSELKEDIRDLSLQMRENRLATGRLELRFDHMERRMCLAEEDLGQLKKAIH